MGTRRTQDVYKSTILILPNYYGNQDNDSIAPLNFLLLLCVLCVLGESSEPSKASRVSQSDQRPASLLEILFHTLLIMDKCDFTCVFRSSAHR